jgi:hypothetical protein
LCLLVVTETRRQRIKRLSTCGDWFNQAKRFATTARAHVGVRSWGGSGADVASARSYEWQRGSYALVKLPAPSGGVLSEGEKRDSKGQVVARLLATLLRSQHLGLGRGGPGSPFLIAVPSQGGTPRVG